MVKYKKSKTIPSFDLPVCNWELVRSYRDFINYLSTSKDSSGYPTLAMLEHSWNILSNDYKVIARDDDEKISDLPITAFMFFIDLGFYPPPEILLAIHKAYETYMTYDEPSFEDVFFGPPIKRAGNFSARHKKEILIMHMNSEFQKLLKKGMRRIEAAEIISEKFNNAYEPESLLRIFRGKTGKKKRINK